MIKPDDYELTRRRTKLLIYYQQNQSNIDNRNSGNFNHISSSSQILGRPVTQIHSAVSKESRLNESYMNSTKEDRLLQNYVNTVKKIETHIKFKSRD